MSIVVSSYPILIGHRGYRKHYPENTRISFHAAIAENVSMIELDVKFSRDSEFVVIHDATLERTTNGQGPVNRYTLSELKQLSNGSWYDSRFKSERLLTLVEVLEEFASSILINIEVKLEDSDMPECEQMSAADRLVSLIKKYRAEQRILVSSYNWKILHRIYEQNNDISLGVLVEKKTSSEILTACQQLSAYSVHMSHEEITLEQVRAFKARGYKIFVYTVNTPQVCIRLLKMGIDGIITDDARLWSKFPYTEKPRS